MLSSIPGTQVKMEGETWLKIVVLWFPCPSTNTLKTIYNFLKTFFKWTKLKPHIPLLSLSLYPGPYDWQKPPIPTEAKPASWTPNKTTCHPPVLIHPLLITIFLPTPLPEIRSAPLKPVKPVPTLLCGLPVPPQLNPKCLSSSCHHIQAHTSGRSLLFEEMSGQHPEPQVKLPPTLLALTHHNFNSPPTHTLSSNHILSHTSDRRLPLQQRSGQLPESQRPRQCLEN